MKMYMLNPFVKWSNTLNCWEFPMELKWLEPSDWELIPNFSQDKKIRTKYTDIRFIALIKICNLFSTEKQRLNHWHKFELKRTDQQFEDWYKNRDKVHG